MVEPQPGIAAISVPEVVPEGVDTLAGMEAANGVGPAMFDQGPEGVPHFRPEQRVTLPALRLIDVEFGRRDIVIAGEHDRRVAGDEVGGMGC